MNRLISRVWATEKENCLIAYDVAAGPDQSGYIRCEMAEGKLIYTPITKEEFYRGKKALESDAGEE